MLDSRGCWHFEERMYDEDDVVDCDNIAKGGITCAIPSHYGEEDDDDDDAFIVPDANDDELIRGTSGRGRRDRTLRNRTSGAYASWRCSQGRICGIPPHHCRLHMTIRRNHSSDRGGQRTTSNTGATSAVARVARCGVTVRPRGRSRIATMTNNPMTLGFAWNN